MSGSSAAEPDTEEAESAPDDERGQESLRTDGGAGQRLRDAERDAEEAADAEGGSAADADAEGDPSEIEVEELEADQLDVAEAEDERAVGPDEDDAAEVLYLDLEGLFLNLLGLEVDLSEVELDVSAVPGENRLLGNLLSSVTGLFDGDGLLGSLLPGGDGFLGSLLPGGGGDGEGGGLLRRLLPTGILGSIRDKLGSLVPSVGDITGWLRERLPSPGAWLREYATERLNNLPIEQVVATVVRSALEALIESFEEGGSEATGEEVAADGGPEA